MLFRALGVKITGYVWMRSVDIPRNWPDITLEHDVALDHGVVLLCSGAIRGDKLIIREGTYVNRYTMFDAHEHLEIGRNCMIGPNCYFTDGDHGISRGTSVKAQPMVTAPVIVEDEAWIGAGATILRGVRVGRGAIVGAGSVVTKDVPSDAIVVGSPARVCGMREPA